MLDEAHEYEPVGNQEVLRFLLVAHVGYEEEDEGDDDTWEGN